MAYDAGYGGPSRLVSCRNPNCSASGMGLPPPLLGSNISGQLTSFDLPLSWSMPPFAAQYRLQLIPSGNDGPGLDVHSSGQYFRIPSPPEWYGLLPDMTYTLRMSASNAASFVGLDDPSWGEWTSLILRTPKVDSSTVAPIFPTNGEAISTLTPALQWENKRKDVFYYEVQVSKDLAFNTDPASATAMVYWSLVHGGASIPRNSYAVPEGFPLERGSTYYWRVRPRVQGDGIPVDWTPTQSFTVGPG